MRRTIINVVLHEVTTDRFCCRKFNCLTIEKRRTILLIWFGTRKGTMPWFLFILLHSTWITCATSRSIDISRINQEVYFKSIGSASITTNRWHHTFAFEIPLHDDQFSSLSSRRTDLFIPKYPRTSTNLTSWSVNCFTWIDAQINGNTTDHHHARPETNPRSLCSRYSGVIRRLLEMLKQDHDNLII